MIICQNRHKPVSYTAYQDNNLQMSKYIRPVMRPISVGIVPLRLLSSIGDVGEGEDNRYKARSYVRTDTNQFHTPHIRIITYRCLNRTD